MAEATFSNQKNVRDPAAQLRNFGWSILAGGFILALLIWVLFPNPPQTDENAMGVEAYKQHEAVAQRL